MNKRPITIRKWWKRNCLNVALVGVILGSMTIGYVAGILTPFESKAATTIEVEEPQPTVNDVIEVVEEVVEETHFYYEVPLDHDLQDYIRELCDKYGVPMSLVIAMIDQESTFHPDVISKTNDYGLMQINKINHENLKKTFEVTDFLDPYQNVLCGIYIIGGNLKYTEGDMHKALMMYNMGANGAKNLWKKGTYTSSYSRNVMEKYEVYHNMEVVNE